MRAVKGVSADNRRCAVKISTLKRISCNGVSQATREADQACAFASSGKLLQHLENTAATRRASCGLKGLRGPRRRKRRR